MQVARQASNLELPLPEGRRASYPVDAEALTSLAERNGVRSSCDRLLQALALDG
jgi:hypothetical protein